MKTKSPSLYDKVLSGQGIWFQVICPSVREMAEQLAKDYLKFNEWYHING